MNQLKHPDLSDPDLHAGADLHAAWAHMRTHRPVCWQSVGDTGFWSVTRYRDVDRVLRDFATFTSEHGTLLSLLGKRDPASGRQLAATDPPAHERMRTPLYRAMGAQATGTLAPQIRLAVRQIVQPLADREPVDLASALTALPLALIGPLLVLPRTDWPRLSHLVMMCSAEDDPEFQANGSPEHTLRLAHRELFGYFVEVVRARSGHRGGSDLVSLMLQGGADPATVVSNCYSLLLGAGVTLPNVPTAAIWQLIRDGALETWANRPDLLDTGVEEALRWASPAKHVMRHTLRAVQLSGVDIPAGQAVVAWIGSANRDPAAMWEPDWFDLSRSPNRHLAFGSGRHNCLGSQLARLTLRVFFSELFALCAGLELVQEPVRVRSTFLAGFKRMVVRSGGMPCRTGR